MTATVKLETGVGVAPTYRGLQPRASLLGHPVPNLAETAGVEPACPLRGDGLANRWLTIRHTLPLPLAEREGLEPSEPGLPALSVFETGALPLGRPLRETLLSWCAWVDSHHRLTG